MISRKRKSAIRRWTRNLGQLPGSLLQYMKSKADSLFKAIKTTDSAGLLPLAPQTIRRLEDELKQQLKAPAHSYANLTGNEQALITQIRQQTLKNNRNNVTRTKAYWELYEAHPELHWALLAHMVSRNGGWTMTDLKGELLPHLLSGNQIEHLFQFLERANGLIFHDAYPQLLLYQESKRRNRSLFHLLPKFGISSFMQAVWRLYWEQRDSVLLTICLIINEQNYIESRIVLNPKYRATALDTLTFKAQSVLQLNQVMFPYQQPVPPSDVNNATPASLAGLILEDFTDLKERIEFGKKLYAILFGLPAVHRGVVAFARSTPHTGSRADYWPELFASIRKAPPEPKFKERLDGCKLVKGAAPFYSPALAQAWTDRKLEPAEPGDWFVNLNALQHVRPIPVPMMFDMNGEACFALNKIELAIIAAQAIKQ